VWRSSFRVAILEEGTAGFRKDDPEEESGAGRGRDPRVEHVPTREGGPANLTIRKETIYRINGEWISKKL